MINSNSISSDVEIFAIMPNGISNKCSTKAEINDKTTSYTAIFVPTEVGM